MNTGTDIAKDKLLQTLTFFVAPILALSAYNILYVPKRADIQKNYR